MILTWLTGDLWKILGIGNLASISQGSLKSESFRDGVASHLGHAIESRINAAWTQTVKTLCPKYACHHLLFLLCLFFFWSPNLRLFNKTKAECILLPVPSSQMFPHTPTTARGKVSLSVATFPLHVFGLAVLLTANGKPFQKKVP